MGDHHDETVLVIKAAQGNRSIGFDINPPSSRKGLPKTGTYYPGWQYDIFVGNVHKTLDNLQEYFPEYKGQGYEIAGFCWWQGHKDGGMEQELYEYHLANLIKDLRQEFDAPQAPFSIATVGFGGENMHWKNLRVLEAQMAISDGGKYPDFAGNVASVDTRPFWRSVAISPKDEGYHYNRNAETYLLVGDGLAKNMIKLIEKTSKKDGN
jgi:alpha-galactosidase